jgi:hypothetical protein
MSLNGLDLIKKHNLFVENQKRMKQEHVNQRDQHIKSKILKGFENFEKFPVVITFADSDGDIFDYFDVPDTTIVKLISECVENLGDIKYAFDNTLKYGYKQAPLLSEIVFWVGDKPFTINKKKYVV